MTAADVLLEESIQPVVVRSRARLFLVDVSDLSVLGLLLGQLEQRGLISRLREFTRSRRIREHYIAYVISDETWNELDRVIRFAAGTTAPVSPVHVEIDTVSDVGQYVITAHPLEEGGWLP